MKGAALRVEHLTKIYPDGTTALRDVSFDVAPGQFVVIIGLSGSGKSTLMRCINRLIEPTSGKIYIDDVDVTALSQAEMRRLRRNIGMIFQQFNLVKRSSVLTNVLCGRLGYLPPAWALFNYFAADEVARALAYLPRFGIPEKARHRDAVLGESHRQPATGRHLSHRRAGRVRRDDHRAGGLSGTRIRSSRRAATPPRARDLGGRAAAPEPHAAPRRGEDH